MHPKKILVVEDSKLLQKMYSLVMMQWRNKGATLISAYNGQEALERLAEHPDVEIILLDINMPVMSGIQFLEHCATRNVHRHIPVIIISTEGKEQDIIQGLKAGAKAFLKKPFHAPELLVAIEKVYRTYWVHDPPTLLTRPLGNAGGEAILSA